MNSPRDSAARPERMISLVVMGCASSLVYVVIAFLSSAFEFEAPTRDRPLILVLSSFGVAMVLYLLALRRVAEMRRSPRLLAWIVGAALLFRVVMLFSVPIQEVDIYRYIWDGVVSSQGVSPFRYPPDQVELTQTSNDPELARLIRRRSADEAIAETLRRVHFGELPTIYPSTSQAIFLAAAWTTPENASVVTRLRVMKLWLIAFDLGIIVLVIRLLRLCDLPAELVVAYAWCPLVMKEVANSGHLDTIAVFLCVWAVYRIAVAVDAKESADSPGRTTLGLTWTAAILAAAIGAKLYPIVLAPLFLFVSFRKFGWRCVVVPSVVCVLLTGALLAPMMPRHVTSGVRVESELPAPVPDDASPFKEVADTNHMGNAADAPRESIDPSLGVRTFLKQWEMNDFIFMLLIENLKTADQFPRNHEVWFSIVPETIRASAVEFVSRSLRTSPESSPFFITRAATSALFLGLALWWAWRASSEFRAVSICRYAFLTLAWFWLLSPTQNPWYWLWALPLLPFMRNPAWFAMSGIALIYYLRFWFEYHFTGMPVLGTIYAGTDFFDFVITWFEFAPWLICLGVFAVRQRNSQAIESNVICQTESHRHRK